MKMSKLEILMQSAKLVGGLYFAYSFWKIIDILSNIYDILKQ